MILRRYLKRSLNNLSIRVIKSSDIRIITAADETHIASLMQLLESIKLTNNKVLISVYDLGLSSKSLTNLEVRFPNLDIKKYRFENLPAHEQMNYLAGSFAWKPKILEQEAQKESKYLVWMDAGNVLLDDIRSACLISHQLSILAFSTGETIRELTLNRTLHLMNSEGRISNNSQISAAGLIIRNSKYGKRIILEWSKWADVRDAISPIGATRLNHRFDQSIVSILVSRSYLRKKIIDLLTRVGLNNEFFDFKIHQDLE